MKSIIKSVVNILGSGKKSTSQAVHSASLKYKMPVDVNNSNRRILEICMPYTMTSVERMITLLDAVEYVSKNSIAGAFVECGVWKGGSSLAAAMKFSEMDSIRDIYLFDTFEGMTPPTELDVDIEGNQAEVLMNMSNKSDNESIWCVSDLDTVKETMRIEKSYPEEKIKYVKGPVEQTIKENIPSSISILRLDTDWYESTKVELENLFPRLVVGGVLIIDDYGHWRGAKRAVDEYLNNECITILLNRIDYTGRVGVKVA